MAETEGKPGGLLAGLRRIGNSLLTLAQNRLQLFALELQSERLRLVDLVLKLAVALAMGFVGLLLGTLTLALFVWRLARWGGLLAMTFLFVAGAAFLLWRLREGLRKGPVPFAKTIAEFEKDRECFKSKD